jgi:predicted double-glycine peptidase
VNSTVTDVLDEAAAVPKALGAAWWARGLTLAERRALPGVPMPAPDLVERAARPDWADVAEAALARMPEAGSEPDPAGSQPAAALAGFSVITAPFTTLACERFVAAAAAEGLDEAVELAELRSGLADSLARRLVSLASRTLVLELNVLRVTGRLTGPDLVTMDPAQEAHEASVSRVGLLPALMFGKNGAALDLSGNGGDPGAQLPFKTAGWAGAGTDEMHLVREQPPFPGSDNRPRLGDVTADATDFAAGLLEGFRTSYGAIAARAGELAAVHGPLGRFACDELRVVVRATRVYANLLYESTHPDVLRDALDRDRILDYLWTLSRDDLARQRLIDHEQADLWAGDVPFFAVRPGSRAVWTSVGERLPDVLAEAGLERSARKLQRMGPRDRRVQEWIIQASLATRRATGQDGEAGGGRDVTRRGRPRPADRIDPERALAAARAVGDRLAEPACRDRDRVSWLGLHFAGESQWLVQPLDLDLYSGYPGVAVFLGQLAALTGEQRYAELARRIVAPIKQLADVFDDQPADPSRCSAFSSLAGVAYALAHVAKNLASPELAAPVAAAGGRGGIRGGRGRGTGRHRRQRPRAGRDALDPSGDRTGRGAGRGPGVRGSAGRDRQAAGRGRGLGDRDAGDAAADGVLAWRGGHGLGAAAVRRRNRRSAVCEGGAGRVRLRAIPIPSRAWELARFPGSSRPRTGTGSRLAIADERVVPRRPTDRPGPSGQRASPPSRGGRRSRSGAAVAACGRPIPKPEPLPRPARQPRAAHRRRGRQPRTRSLGGTCSGQLRGRRPSVRHAQEDQHAGVDGGPGRDRPRAAAAGVPRPSPVGAAAATTNAMRMMGRRWKARRRSVPLRYQFTAAECGAACLAMVASSFGRHTSVSECRELLGLGRDGASAKRLADAAASIGIQATAERCDDPFARALDGPAIAYYARHHFVVVERLGHRYVRLADPAGGRQLLTREEFRERYGGVLIRLARRRSSRRAVWHGEMLFLADTCGSSWPPPAAAACWAGSWPERRCCRRWGWRCRWPPGSPSTA